MSRASVFAALFFMACAPSGEEDPVSSDVVDIAPGEAGCLQVGSMSMSLPDGVTGHVDFEITYDLAGELLDGDEFRSWSTEADTHVQLQGGWTPAGGHRVLEDGVVRASSEFDGQGRLARWADADEVRSMVYEGGELVRVEIERGSKVAEIRSLILDGARIRTWQIAEPGQPGGFVVEELDADGRILRRTKSRSGILTTDETWTWEDDRLVGYLSEDLDDDVVLERTWEWDGSLPVQATLDVRGRLQHLSSTMASTWDCPADAAPPAMSASSHLGGLGTHGELPIN